MKSPKYKKVSELTGTGYEYFEYQYGTKAWYLNGEYHREDGPAIERPGGSKAWVLNGKKISLETKSDDPKVKFLQSLMKLQEILES